MNESNKRITTMEVEFHRYILAEYNTHSALSKNASSSRAISILNQLKMLSDSPAMPIFYGADKKGMSADGAVTKEQQRMAEASILRMRDFCAREVQFLKEECNLHKQHANRYVEPWQVVKGVVTATEFKNFFALRNHKDAQPEIQELADCMEKALLGSKPEILKPGQWHLPYIRIHKLGPERLYISNKTCLKLEDALKVSSSCCAQVSYRILDQSVAKALGIYDSLVTSVPVHASPFEHQAKVPEHENVEGITHVNSKGDVCSGNLIGWIQHRHLIEGNTVEG